MSEEEALARAIAESEAPAGFRAMNHPSPFGRHNGPFFEKGEGEGYVRGFRVLERHCNRGGRLHGGMLTTFADMVLGSAATRATGTPNVTVRLIVDFITPARRGAWVEGQARIVRAGRSLVFVEGELRVGHRDIATASGMFKPIRT